MAGRLPWPPLALEGEASSTAGSLGEEITLPIPGGELRADLSVPPGARGIVLFAHGSGSGRKSPRNRWVAEELTSAGIGTLLVDLLTPREAEIDAGTRRDRFDIPLLADRLIGSVDRITAGRETAGKPVGLYGASTGGAAALLAAAARPGPVRALVLRGARSDLAGREVARVHRATLFLVGEFDPEIRTLNEHSLAELSVPRQLFVLPQATHLFEEPGALEAVSRHARDGLLRYLGPAREGRASGDGTPPVRPTRERPGASPPGAARPP